jgi:hypothetical protein
MDLVEFSAWQLEIYKSSKYTDILSHDGKKGINTCERNLHRNGRWSNMGSKKDCLTLISTNPISICSSHVNTKIVLDIGKLVSNMLYSCSS